MSHPNVSLSEKHLALAREQAARSGLGSAEDYLAALIEEDQRRTSPEVERLLEETLAKGDVAEFTAAEWAELRERARVVSQCVKQGS